MIWLCSPSQALRLSALQMNVRRKSGDTHTHTHTNQSQEWEGYDSAYGGNAGGFTSAECKSETEGGVILTLALYPAPVMLLSLSFFPFV